MNIKKILRNIGLCILALSLAMNFFFILAFVRQPDDDQGSSIAEAKTHILSQGPVWKTLQKDRKPGRRDEPSPEWFALGRIVDNLEHLPAGLQEDLEILFVWTLAGWYQATQKADAFEDSLKWKKDRGIVRFTRWIFGRGK